MLAVRARALIEGRLAPSVDDVVALAEPVLKHRMALTFAARADGETIPSVIRRLPARLEARGHRWPASGSFADGRPLARPSRSRRCPDAGAAHAAPRPRGAPRRRDRWRTASTAAAGPGPARPSGSSGPSSPARRRSASTGAAPPATTISTCASANGRRRIRSGSGSTARPRWAIVSDLAQRAEDRTRARARPRRSADIFVEAGERVGLLGLMPPARHPPASSRRIAEALVADRAAARGRPAARGRRSRTLDEAVLIGDFLSPRRRDREPVVEGIVGARRARPPRHDRRSGRGDVSRSQGQAVLHDLEAGIRLRSATPAPGARAYRDRMARASRRARRPGPPPRLDADHPSHRPAGERGGAAPPARS